MHRKPFYLLSRPASALANRIPREQHRPYGDEASSYPSLARTCAALIESHFPQLDGVIVHAVPASADEMHSPLAAHLYEVSFFDHEYFEFMIGVDTDLVPAKVLIAGLAHELGHVVLDAERDLSEHETAADRYESDAQWQHDEEVLANAEAIRAGLGPELWRTARWLRAAFNESAPLAAVRDAYRLLDDLAEKQHL